MISVVNRSGKQSSESQFPNDGGTVEVVVQVLKTMEEDSKKRIGWKKVHHFPVSPYPQSSIHNPRLQVRGPLSITPEVHKALNGTAKQHLGANYSRSPTLNFAKMGSGFHWPPRSVHQEPTTSKG